MGLTFGMALLVAIFAAVIRAEYEAWTPWLAKKLRKLAVASLPSALRERFDEEWAAYLEETPGYIGKMVAALGFVVAACRVTLPILVRTVLANIVFIPVNPLFASGKRLCEPFLSTPALQMTFGAIVKLGLGRELIVASSGLALWTVALRAHPTEEEASLAERAAADLRTALARSRGQRTAVLEMAAQKLRWRTSSK